MIGKEEKEAVLNKIKKEIKKSHKKEWGKEKEAVKKILKSGILTRSLSQNIV